MQRLLAILALLILTGCARDPAEQVVSVPTAVRFATWRSHLASDSSLELRRRVELALQEIRMKEAAEREIRRGLGEKVAGSVVELDEAVRRRVDGRRLREVIQLGFELRLRRLKEELAGLEDAVKGNAGLVTRPGDVDSKHHLEGLRDRQLQRVESYRADIAATERALEPLLAKTGRRLVNVSNDTLDLGAKR
jgi:hypothetical protein